MVIEHIGVSKTLGLTGLIAGSASALMATTTTDPVAISLASKMAEGSVLLIILFFFFRYHERQMELKQKDSDKYFETATGMENKLGKLIELQQKNNENVSGIWSKLDKIGSDMRVLLDRERDMTHRNKQND